MDIGFEIGTEEQSSSINSFEEFEYSLSKITKFCTKINSYPNFCSCSNRYQGIRDENIGSFESQLELKMKYLQKYNFQVLELYEKFNVLMKEHYADYLSNESLYWHPKLGIPAANVAPEFGVTESITFLKLLKITY